jgi:hypothetical protein
MVGIMKRSEVGCVTLSTLFTLEVKTSMVFLEIEAETSILMPLGFGIVKCGKVSWA